MADMIEKLESERDKYKAALEDIRDMDGKGADLGIWRAIAEAVLK